MSRSEWGGSSTGLPKRSFSVGRALRRMRGARTLSWRFLAQVGCGVLCAGGGDPGHAAECVPTHPSEVEAAVEDARRVVLTLDTATTLEKFDTVVGSIECLTGTLPTESLARLYYFTGLSHFLEGNEARARQHFRDAAAIFPLLQEDRESSPAVQALWADARQQAVRSSGTLSVPGLPRGAVAYVDGRPLSLETATQTLYPGAHLLQVWGDDQRLHNRLMRVQADETTTASGEFVASLTPRGELVIITRPGRTDLRVRAGDVIVHEQSRAPRRVHLTDLKQGSYIVEASRAGYHPLEQGKVAVEGGDITRLRLELVHRSTLALVVRGGGFWISSIPGDSAADWSLELVGRSSSGWGLHLEYLHHRSLSESPPELFSANPDYVENPYEGTYLFGPPEFPNVSLRELPFGARLYIGGSHAVRFEDVTLSAGIKAALELIRASAFLEVDAAYELLPWVSLSVRTGLGTMIHLGPYLRDRTTTEPLVDYIGIGLIGLVHGGVRVGF